ncbi:MAG TPA: S8 family serine peptidase, partial [Gaiellaceae bacterium]|nr:S8 family serine peptidase [Gaiellaceae bacterium]
MKRLTLLAAAFTITCAFAGSAAAAGNPFGVTVVRFTPQTTPAQMRAQVAAAGGVVVADLSAIDALAVVPRASDFDSRLSSSSSVTTLFKDTLFTSDRLTDGLRGGGQGAATDTGSGSEPVADPWHSLFQWDDDRMDVQPAWRRTTGDHSIAVAVLDTGVDASHRELRGVVDPRLGGNFIPCSDLVALFGLGVIDRKGLRDCRDGDFEGHGTWVASRIAGALNGFASNGVAPGVRIGSYKVMAAGLGGLSTWILSGLLAACSDPRIDVVNMSIEAYADPSDPAQVDDFLLFTDAVNYCLSRGVPVFAAAGNAHVRVDRVDLTLEGRRLQDVGQVSLGPEGIATVTPGTVSPQDFDLRGGLVIPGGVPGVTMVSATANAIGRAPASVPLRWQAHVGSRDQLAYYSNYGSRVDLAAPGGARAYEIPGYDGGAGDILAGRWGSFGALAKNGLICTDPFAGSLFNSACFTARGDAYGWLQGTSMAAPNAAGVAALVLSAHHDLVGRPDALVQRLADTADRSPVNFMGPNDPDNTAPALDGTPCPTAFCHVDQNDPIGFADAYGAGLVDAA